MSRVLIVGAGAAGMYAAVWAARNGQEVCVFEKMKKPEKNCLLPERDAAILPMPAM